MSTKPTAKAKSASGRRPTPSVPSASGPPRALSANQLETQAAIDAFRRWFDEAFGARRYPGELTVDLTDLLLTLKKLEARLIAMTTATAQSRAAARRDLFHLRIEITDDLPMIFSDVKRSIDVLIGAFDAADSEPTVDT